MDSNEITTKTYIVLATTANSKALCLNVSLNSVHNVDNIDIRCF